MIDPGGADSPAPEPDSLPAVTAHAAGAGLDGLGSGEEDAKAEPPEPPTRDDSRPAGSSFAVRNIDSASKPVVTVNLGTSVQEALTRMDREKFSQLPVMAGERSIKGIVSYRSIARAQLHGHPKVVADCLDAGAPQVGLDTPLIDVIGLMFSHDCVLILADDRKLSGIVTPADIANEFKNIAGPFMVIAEIEKDLRWLVDRVPGLYEAATAGPGSTWQQVADSSELTMGELQRLFEDPELWTQTGLKFDRSDFCKGLDEIRKERNALLHFRESIGPDALQRLRNFADMLHDACVAISRSAN